MQSRMNSSGIRSIMNNISVLVTSTLAGTTLISPPVSSELINASMFTVALSSLTTIVSALWVVNTTRVLATSVM